MTWKFLVFLLYLLTFATCVHADSDEDSETDVHDEGIPNKCKCETETYEANQENGIIKSPNYPRFGACNGACVYIIEPHPTKPVNLYTSHYQVSSDASLTIYETFYYNGTLLKIPHASITKPRSYFYSRYDEENFPTFVSAIGAGMEIHFHNWAAPSNYANFKISFDRFNDDGEELCDYPVKVVGLEDTIIQNDRNFKFASGCVYYLVPNPDDLMEEKEEAEIVVTVHGSDENLISVRVPDENGEMKAKLPSYRARLIRESAHNLTLISVKESRTDKTWKMSKITARLVNRACKCPSETLIKNIQSVTVRSPGWPDLYCPNVICDVYYSFNNTPRTDNKIALVEVSLSGLFGRNDLFSVRTKSNKYFEVDLAREHGVQYNEKFVIRQETIGVLYRSSEAFHKRNWEVNLTQVFVTPGCLCNAYMDKVISNPASFLIMTQDCTFYYCHFKFKPLDRQRFALSTNVLNAVETDSFRVRSNDYSEQFTGLEEWTRSKSYETTSEVELFFYRKGANLTKYKRQMIIEVNWIKVGTGAKCDDKTVNIELNERYASARINTPGYPQNYENSDNCRWLVTGDDKSLPYVHITDFELEPFHDHLKIYDGNSSDGQLLYSFTGHLPAKMVNLTKYPFFITFESDASTTAKGFNIRIFNEYIESEVTKQDSNWLSHLIIALILLAVFAFVGAIAFLYKFGYLTRISGYLLNIKTRYFPGQQNRAADEKFSEIPFNANVNVAAPTSNPPAISSGSIFD